MAQPPSHRIVFMGTPEFAVPSLDRLVEAGLKPIAVVTAPDRPRGRGQRMQPSAVKMAAIAHGIERILQPESVRDPAFAERIRALEPDVIVVVAFRILPPAVFEAARLGAFNLHGSLLPAFRGAAPINRAVMQGETRTGVTTFFLKAAVDTGNVILQREMAIGPEETAGEVHDRMMEIGADAVLETTRRILDGTAQAVPQDDSLATPAPKIFREDCRIPWRRDARSVHDHVRGLSPYPGAWTMHGDRQIKIFRTRVSQEQENGDPGYVIAADGGIRVACGSGAVDVLELQPEGSTRMSSVDFLNGYQLAPGDRLE
jgi:methionyl-tRNA formyltransferase